MNKKNRYLVHVKLGADEFDLKMPLSPAQYTLVHHDYAIDMDELGFANWETLSEYVKEYLLDNPQFYDLKDMLREFSVFATMDSFNPLPDSEEGEQKEDAVNLSLGKDSENTLFSAEGIYDMNIRTFCIFPQGTHLWSAYPLKPKRKPKVIHSQWRMKEYLMAGGFPYLRLMERDSDTPYIVFNLPIEEAKHIAFCFAQPSFLFAIVRNQNLDTILYSTYRINDNQTDYVESETEIVPYPDIISACHKFNNAINKQKTRSEKYREEFERWLNNGLDDNKTGKSRYLSRCLIYKGLPIK